MAITFQLDRPDNRRSTIMMTYRKRGFRFRHSLGISIPPEQWNAKKGCAKSGIDKEIIDDHIVLLTSVVHQCLSHYRVVEQRLPTYDEMKNYCLIHYTIKYVRHEEVSAQHAKRSDHPSHTKYVVPYFQHLIETWRNDNRIKKASLKVYQRTVNILRDAIGEDVRISDLDKTHVDMFVQHMRNKGAMDNYIKKAMDNLKTLGLDMVKEFNLTSGIDKYLSPRNYGLKAVPKDTIYLTEEELVRISHYDFSDNPRFETVKDMFLFACYTGLRYSDVNNSIKFEIKNGDGRHWLRYRQIKTNKEVIVPVKSEAKSLYEKYPQGFPKRSNVEINRCLKEIGRLAEIIDDVKITEFRNGKPEDYYVKKYEILTSHTARRTFCTLAYRAGVPAHTIMAFSGHASESSFRRYLRFNEEEAIKDGSNHVFFN